MLITGAMGLAAAFVLGAVLDVDDGSRNAVATLFAAAGFVLGGFRAGLLCPSAPLANGAGAAIVGYVPLGIVQRLAAEKPIRPIALLFAALLAGCLGVFGGIVANSANRSRG